eukprot:Gb_38658 [translate_table: standard]
MSNNLPQRFVGAFGTIMAASKSTIWLRHCSPTTASSSMLCHLCSCLNLTLRVVAIELPLLAFFSFFGFLPIFLRPLLLISSSCPMLDPPEIIESVHPLALKLFPLNGPPCPLASPLCYLLFQRKLTLLTSYGAKLSSSISAYLNSLSNNPPIMACHNSKVPQNLDAQFSNGLELHVSVGVLYYSHELAAFERSLPASLSTMSTYLLLLPRRHFLFAPSTDDWRFTDASLTMSAKSHPCRSSSPLFSSSRVLPLLLDTFVDYQIFDPPSTSVCPASTMLVYLDFSYLTSMSAKPELTQHSPSDFVKSTKKKEGLEALIRLLKVKQPLSMKEDFKKELNLEVRKFLKKKPPFIVVAEGMIDLVISNNKLIGGDDFQSGHRKIKSMLVDFLVDAGINICINEVWFSWFLLQSTAIVSYNHFGNYDGMNLSAPQTFRSKEISKSNVVDDMVSSNAMLYEPDEHTDYVVVIKVPNFPIIFISPMTFLDNKRAMDEYTFEIFMGGKNTIVLHNMCEECLLATPLILDLKFHSFHLVETMLSYLTKAPLVPLGTLVVNALAKQREMLENIMRECIGLALENNIVLEYK